MDKPIALAIQVILLLVLFFLQPILGPYGILFIGCGLGIMASTIRLALLTSFITAFSLWVSFAIYVDMGTKFHIGRVVTALFSLPLPLFSYLLSGLVGGIPCALIALTTFYVKKAAFDS